MKTVKKYATFEDLKASEGKTLNYELSLKKHNEFEKVIMSVKTIKGSKSVSDKSK